MFGLLMLNSAGNGGAQHFVPAPSPPAKSQGSREASCEPFAELRPAPFSRKDQLCPTVADRIARMASDERPIRIPESRVGSVSFA